MKTPTTLILAACCGSAFAQTLLGPLGQAVQFKRMQDGPNTYVIIEDPAKQLHQTVKGSLVPADPTKDTGVPIFVTIVPNTVQKCDAPFTLYSRRVKPKAGPKDPPPQGDFDTWVAAYSPNPKEPAIVTSRPGQEIEAECLQIK